MKKYLILKLTNGSDVIGEHVKSTRSTSETSKQHVVLKTPMAIMTSVLQNGATVVILRSYALLSQDENISFDRNHIVTQYIPDQTFIEYYTVMIDYNKKFIDDDMLKGMKSAIEVIRDVVDVGNSETFSRQKNQKNTDYKSLEYWESLIKSDKKH